MRAIDNSAVLDLYYNSCSNGELEPAVDYAYDADGATLQVNDTSAYGAYARKRVNIYATDVNGDTVTDSMSSGVSTKTLDVSSLDPSEGFNLRVTVVSSSGDIADLSAYKIGAISPATGNTKFTNMSHR